MTSDARLFAALETRKLVIVAPRGHKTSVNVEAARSHANPTEHGAFAKARHCHKKRPATAKTTTATAKRTNLADVPKMTIASRGGAAKAVAASWFPACLHSNAVARSASTHSVISFIADAAMPVVMVERFVRMARVVAPMRGASVAVYASTQKWIRSTVGLAATLAKIANAANKGSVFVKQIFRIVRRIAWIFLRMIAIAGRAGRLVEVLSAATRELANAETARGSARESVSISHPTTIIVVDATNPAIFCANSAWGGLVPARPLTLVAVGRVSIHNAPLLIAAVVAKRVRWAKFVEVGSALRCCRSLWVLNIPVL